MSPDTTLHVQPETTADPPDAERQPPSLDHDATADAAVAEAPVTAAAPSAHPGSASDEALSVLPKVFKIIGSVVAPTTLLTALLFYFGRLHITGFFQYFGVNFTALDLTTQDYLIRSADGLFVPVAVAAAVALLLVWLHRLLLRRAVQRNQTRLPRAVAFVYVGVGLLLGGTAVIGVLDPAVFGAVPELPGLALAIGVLCLSYASRLLRAWGSWASPAPLAGSPGAIAVVEWALVFVLVSVGLFWTVGNYALAVGTGRGHDIEASLATWPDAVLLSEQRLGLVAAGVTELQCADADAAYAFRYDGLKLVMQSGDQYFFLPATWSRGAGAAILIPRSDAVRLEFTLADADVPSPGATC